MGEGENDEQTGSAHCVPAACEALSSIRTLGGSRGILCGRSSYHFKCFPAWITLQNAALYISLKWRVIEVVYILNSVLLYNPNSYNCKLITNISWKNVKGIFDV